MHICYIYTHKLIHTCMYIIYILLYNIYMHIYVSRMQISKRKKTNIQKSSNVDFSFRLNKNNHNITLHVIKLYLM